MLIAEILVLNIKVLFEKDFGKKKDADDIYLHSIGFLNLLCQPDIFDIDNDL